MIVAPVKQVLSGDTIVVVGSKGATLRVSLTGLKAPRFPQPPKAGAAAPAGSVVDEVFGLEAREFLRPLVVGKKVVFRIDQKHPQNADQVYATVWIGTSLEGNKPEASVNAMVSAGGWARLKEADFTKASFKDTELEALLRKSCAEAEAASRGVFQSANLAKRIFWEFPTLDEFETFADALKKQKTTRATIEYCRDGATFRVLLLDSKVMLWFSLAGVQSARKPMSEKKEDEEDSLAAEARKFTEVRLLQREVTLEVGGFDPASKMFFGSVNHPNGIIAEELLKNGWGKMADWSVSMLVNPRDETPRFRALQKDAQEKRLGCWKDFIPRSLVTSGDLKEFDGVVAEVVSGDTLVVRIGSSPEQLRDQPWTCEEKRVSLSSIQAPRLGPKSAEGSADEKFAFESREFLRGKFAGQRVKVTIDYSRQAKQAPESAAPPPVRHFATVIASKTNIAVDLVKQGLAEVVAHRADDDRSPQYDDLLAAQQEAKQAKRNLWSPKDIVGGKDRRLNLTGDAVKAKTFMPHLQREKDAKHRCVMEWITNGSRFGLDLPEQNCNLSFALAGITCPSTAKRNVKDSVDEFMAKEALAFSRACALQVNGIKCRVETMDRAGTFLGTLFVPFKSNPEENLSLLLLERGLAKVQPFSADQTRYKSALYEAEKRAKLARLGVWRDWDGKEDLPSAEDASEDAPEDSDPSAPLKFVPLVATDVVCGDALCVRWKTAKCEEDKIKVDQDMERVLASQQAGGLTQVKKGQAVCAAFDDGTGLKFYRAKVEFVNNAQQSARVKFIDFGNEDTVSFSKLRAQSSVTASIPALAVEKRLAFVKCRQVNEEYGREAAMALSDLVYAGAPDLVGCDTKFGLVLAFKGAETTAEEGEAVPSINREIVAQGLGFVRTKETRRVVQQALKEVVASMQEAEDHAHRKHLNLWQFGDPRQDEDD